MTNAVSRVSSTTVRNRTMASVPTRLKARAMLFPMTTVTRQISSESRIRVVRKDGSALRSPRRQATPYTPAARSPRANAAPSRTASTRSSIGAPSPAAWVRKSTFLRLLRIHQDLPRPGCPRRGGRRHAAYLDAAAELGDPGRLRGQFRQQPAEELRNTVLELQLEERAAGQELEALLQGRRFPAPGRNADQIFVDGQADALPVRHPEERAAAVPDPAGRGDALFQGPVQKPPGRPARRRNRAGQVSREPGKIFGSDLDPALADPVAPLDLPLQEDERRPAVAAEPQLASAIALGAMEDVEARGVAIHRRDPIAAVLPVRIRAQVAARPRLHPVDVLLRQFEFQLVGDAGPEPGGLRGFGPIARHVCGGVGARRRQRSAR